MAFTRRLGNSRQLRSGRILRSPPFPTSVSKRGSSSKQPAQSQKPRSLRRVQSDNRCVSEASGREFHDTGPDFEPDPSVTRASLPSSATCDQFAIDADAASLTFNPLGERDIDAAINAPEDLPISLEDAALPSDDTAALPDDTEVLPDDAGIFHDDTGLPSDEFWHHDAVYDRRFCFEHGETEYLLGTPDRWMHPDDFDTPNAESKLKALFDKSKDTLPDFDPHSRRCQAECWSSLYSQVYAVVDIPETENSSLYLVRWKACWTLESNINDKGWLAPSLKEAQKNRGCRRSKRLENSFEKTEENYHKIMLVVRLD